MFPRISYLYLLIPKLKEFFEEYIDQPMIEDSDFWFEYDGAPIRIDLPVGVLFDSFVNKEGDPLPWSVTLHYKNYPEQFLI